VAHYNHNENTNFDETENLSKGLSPWGRGEVVSFYGNVRVALPNNVLVFIEYPTVSSAVAIEEFESGPNEPLEFGLLDTVGRVTVCLNAFRWPTPSLQVSDG
jgi:hypothetical protein